MEIYVKKGSLPSCGEPLLAVGCFEDESGMPPAFGDLDRASGGLVSRAFSSGEFSGAADDRLLLHLSDGDGPARLLIIGLGKKEDDDAETLRKAAAAAALAAKGAHSERLAMALPFAGEVPVAEQARALIEGAGLALYDYTRYRSPKPKSSPEVGALALVSHGDAPEDEIEAGVSLGRIGVECASLCRDLGNTPALDATPAWVADRAREIAKAHGLRVEVLERKDMEEAGMGGLLGVASGSAQPPKLVVLEHNGDREDLPTICLVGKGVTFDAGGISIKPSLNLHEMKFDKCGACAIIAAMQAVAVMKLPLRVVGITPLTENMPSGSAYRPGDVLTCSNGKTIEVLNTDAEGRLILADALVYATRYRPTAIIDLATLTGACMIALGEQCAGLMSTDDRLAERLVEAGEATGERLWRLPLFPGYRKQLDSEVADMTNLGGREAGAITAACLLREFVEDYPWAHLDIAGVAWRNGHRDYLKKGGTGFGARLLVELLRRWAEEAGA